MNDLIEKAAEKVATFENGFLSLLEKGLTKEEGFRLLNTVKRDYLSKKNIFIPDDIATAGYFHMMQSIYTKTREKLIEMGEDVQHYPSKLKDVQIQD